MLIIHESKLIRGVLSVILVIGSLFGQIGTTVVKGTPLFQNVNQLSGQILGIIINGDIWFHSLDNNSNNQITFLGDIQAFTWSPDGERIATYDGLKICIVDLTKNNQTECHQLNQQGYTLTTPPPTPNITFKMIWSPDQSHIVITNRTGLAILPLDNPNSPIIIKNPVDFGVDMGKGKQSISTLNQAWNGDIVFLDDGSLVASFTHPTYFGHSQCYYVLYSFDFNTNRFTKFVDFGDPGSAMPSPGNLAVTKDRKTLYYYGVGFVGAEHYTTTIDKIDVGSKTIQHLPSIPQTYLESFDLLSIGSQALVSYIGGSPSYNGSFNVLPIQIWDLNSGSKLDLDTGINPAWSPDGNYFAYSKIDSITLSFSPQPLPKSGSPIMIASRENRSFQTIQIDNGTDFAWRPAKTHPVINDTGVSTPLLILIYGWAGVLIIGVLTIMWILWKHKTQ